MKKKILVIQQVPHEGTGTIGPLAARAGFEFEVVKVYRQGLAGRIPRSIDGYSALIVLGGPMGVYDADSHPFIAAELRLIESALRAGAGVLGICLGAQLLAHAAGARVTSGETKEIGWYRVRLTGDGLTDRLTRGLPAEFHAFQWHGDTFGIPAGSVNLATSDLFENQLIRVAPRAYGVQFHLEVTPAMVAEWMDMNAAELDEVSDYIDPGAIAAETAYRMPGLHRIGETVVNRFLRMVAL